MIPYSTANFFQRASAIAIAAIVVGAGWFRCDAQITDTPEWADHVAGVMNADSGHPKEGFEQYGREFVKGMGRMTPEQQIRIFGYLPSPPPPKSAPPPPPEPPLDPPPPDPIPTPDPLDPVPPEPIPQDPPAPDPTPVPAPDPVTPPATLTTLDPPTFSPGSGAYLASAFSPGLTVTVNNPNGSDSNIMVSVNGAGFVRYTAPLSVSPDTTVRAYVEGDPTRYQTSSTVAATYTQQSSQLSPPQITTSANSFVPGTRETIRVTITNPNVATISAVRFRIKEGQGNWATYTQPFDIHYASFPNGATIDAEAIATDLSYTDSDRASATVTSPPPGDSFFVHTDCKFEKLKGGSKMKTKLKSNNGHGNNYDGVDGSNPSTIRKLLESPDLPDDEIQKQMPKNSNFLENGEPDAPSELSNGSLFSGAPAYFLPGETFVAGHYSYHNGASNEATLANSTTISVSVTFEHPITEKYKLDIDVAFSAGRGQQKDSDVLEFSQGAAWPTVIVGTDTYTLVPAFAVDGRRNTKTKTEVVGPGQFAVFPFEVVLIPN